MNQFFESLQATLSLEQPFLMRVGLSILTILCAAILRALVLRIVSRSIERTRLLFFIRRIISYGLFSLAAMILLGIWFEGLSGLPTYLGLLSAGLAIAFKDPLANLIAWVYLLSTRLFVVGDRVQIGKDIGDVIDIQAFRIVLLEIGNWVEADQTTGRIIYIPNARVFTETVANYHLGFPYIWNEVSLTITFNSNWKKARSLFLDLLERKSANLMAAAAQSLQEASKQFYIDQKNYRPDVFIRFREYGIVITLRYLCDPRQRRSTENELDQEILNILAQEDDINIAYPSQTIYAQGIYRGPAGS